MAASAAIVRGRPGLKFGRRTLLLLLFAATPILTMLAGMSPYVTYLVYSLNLFLLALALLVGAGVPRFWPTALRALALPALYVVAFMVTSYFGVDFDYSVKYGVLRMPLGLAGVFVWYTIGFCYDERRVAAVVSKAFLVFAVSTLVMARTGILDVGLTRVLNGPEVPIALVAAYLNSAVGVAVVLLLAALASLKKTVVLCSLVALAVVWFVKRRGAIEGWPRMRLSAGRLLAGIVALAVLAVPVAQVATPYIGQTIGRFALESGDVMRVAMTLEFVRLLGEHFPMGTGFYTFGSLTFYTIPYGTFIGNEFFAEGMSLHSMPMHVLLEGGLAVTLIVLLFYWKAFRAAFVMLDHQPSRGAGAMTLGWVFVCLVYGLFNQIHATPYYLGVLGFALGCYHRYLPQLRLARSHRPPA